MTRAGDIWRLGPHRLMCGNARDMSDGRRLMAGAVADVGLCDPPYNVPVDGHVGGLGRTRHREFAEASGEMSPEAFIGFLTLCLSNADHDNQLVMAFRQAPDIDNLETSLARAARRWGLPFARYWQRIMATNPNGSGVL